MDTITVETLRGFSACASGIQWFEDKFPQGCTITQGLKGAIEDKHLSDANWFLVHIMTERQCRAYAIFAAEQVIAIFERKLPGDSRPRNVIEAAKAVLKKDTPENRNKMAAAWAIARAAAWDTGRAVRAVAVVRAAAWDADKLADRTAARDAAWATAWPAARAASSDTIMQRILAYGVRLIVKKRYL